MAMEGMVAGPCPCAATGVTGATIAVVRNKSVARAIRFMVIDLLCMLVNLP
jgi:hypothetical protein